jgi:hypothetical protein
MNDLQRAWLSLGRMIWLLGHPLPPSPVSKLDRRHTGRLRKRGKLFTGEEAKGGGRGAESYDCKESLGKSTLAD